MSETDLNSSFNTDFNAASALLAVGVKQIESENDLFVQEMALAMQYSDDAYEYAKKAHDKKEDAAIKSAIGEGVQASAQAAGGLISLRGGRKMDVERKAALNPQLTQPRPNQTAPQAQGGGRSSVDSQASQVSVDGNSQNHRQSSDQLAIEPSRQSQSQSAASDQRRSTAQSSRRGSDASNGSEDAVRVSFGRHPSESLASNQSQLSQQSQPALDNRPSDANNQQAGQGAQNPADSVKAPLREEAIGGSEEFKQQFNSLDARIGSLYETRTELASKRVDVGDAAGGNQANGANQKLLSEVTPDEYTSWKAESRQRQLQIDRNDPADGLGPGAQAELNQLNRNIRDYELLHRTDSQIADAQTRKQTLVASEQNRAVQEAQTLVNSMNMKFTGYAQIATGVIQCTGITIKTFGEMKGIEADRDNTEAEWYRERAGAMRSLAEQALSNAKSPMQYIQEAYQTTQSAIQKLSTVQA